MPDGAWSPETGYHQQRKQPPARVLRRQRRIALTLLPLSAALGLFAAIGGAWLVVAATALQGAAQAITLYGARPSAIRAAERAQLNAA